MNVLLTNGGGNGSGTPLGRALTDAVAAPVGTVEVPDSEVEPAGTAG